ncbi:MAG: nitrogen regulation protein NR(II) [Rubripirellula sp.]
MFRVQSTATNQKYRLAIIGLLLLSTAALAVTIWVMVDFLREQEIVEDLIRQLPVEATSSAEELAGELRWQFRLTTLVVLNLVVTGLAVVLLWRAYRSSQDSLRDIKALAGDILSSMDQAVITTDSSGNVTSINRRGLELLSPVGECVGRPLSELSREVPLDDFRKDWAAQKPVGMTRDFKVGGNLGERVLRAFCQNLSDINDNQIGFVLQLSDVTTRILIDDRLRRMERYMGLGSMAVGLHHEIKNPLAALSLHVQLLEEQLDEQGISDEAHGMIGIIKTEVTRIGGVLEGFRDFASISTLNCEKVDVQGIVERQVQLIAPQATQQRINVQTVFPDGAMPQVAADRIRLEQVLLNLLVNSMEAMPTGGELKIRALPTKDSVRLEVTDSGPGIPDDLKDSVFDPYFTTKSEGTGLGLALCDKIMRHHHGSLEFRSSTHATTFVMTIPISSDALEKRSDG